MNLPKPTTHYTELFYKPPILKSIWQFYITPKKYEELAREHDLGYDIHSNNKNFIGSNSDLTIRSKIARERRDMLVKSLTGIILKFTVLALFAYFSLWLFDAQASTNFAARFCQILGTSILASATIWKLAPYMQSFGGETLAERVYSWSFTALYYIGSLLLFVGILI